MFESKKQDIAIIGMSCKFPQADSCQEFWDNLVNGKDCVGEVTGERWDTEKYYEKDITNKNKTYAKWCAQMNDIDTFDNNFFNISPKEAQAMDPKQRILLEQVWKCIEDSGIALKHLQKKVTSVYVGTFENDYQNMAAEPSREVEKFTYTGSHEAILANRISYFFDLKGLSMPINTGCSASGVAIYEAQRALQNYECDYALVCGVNVRLTPYGYIGLSKTHMLSPDGQCKTLDADANGYVPGEGVGVLLLQRREEAENNANNIHALVIGTAVNHVGNAGSLTAPSVAGQKRLITSAINNASIHPDTVGYIELHGTGTSLGDPIEIEALKQAYGEYTDKKGYCYIGSAKPFIGHLEGAACIAGVIKVILMFKNRKIPPLNINEINPIINFSETPFMPITGTRDWEQLQERVPLRAGISSFGFGGVNAHIILEEYPAIYQGLETQPEESYLFALSAKTETSLLQQISSWERFLAKEAEGNSLKDMCLTLLTGRQTFSHRIAAFVSSKAEIEQALAKEAALNTTPPTLSLKLGEETWEGFLKVEAYIHGNKKLRMELDKLVTVIEQQKSGIRDFYYGDVWKEEDRPLFTFLTDLGLLTYARHLGCHFLQADGTGLGISISYALMNGNSLLENINEFMTHQEILTAPSAASNLDLLRVWIDGAKLNCSLDEVFELCLHKHKKLYERQMTYTRFIDQWKSVLGKYMPVDFKALDSEASETKKDFMVPALALWKLTIATAIIDSLERLSAKWNISILEEKVTDEWKNILKVFREAPEMREIFAAVIYGGEDELSDILKTCEKDRNDTAIRNEEIVLEFAHDQKYGFYGLLKEVWCMGESIDWSEVFEADSYHKVSLPAYEFDKNSFWLAENNNDIQEVSAGRRLKDLEDLPLKEHNIGGRSLIPGAYYIRHFLEEALPNEQGIKRLNKVELTQVKWIEGKENYSLLALNTGNSLSFLSEEKSGEKFEKKLLAKASMEETLKTEAEIVRRTFSEPASLSREYNQEDVYKLLREKEYYYGKNFRVIQRIEQSTEDCFICRLSTEELHTGKENALIYLLDGILQSIIFAGYALNLLNEEHVYIPTSVDSIEAGPIKGKEFTLEIRGRQLSLDNRRLTADAALFGHSGEEIVSLGQAAFMGMPVDMFTGRRNLNLYKPAWDKTDFIANTEEIESLHNQTALVFATTNEQISCLNRELTKAYKHVVFLKKSTVTKPISSGHYEVNCENISDMKAILEEISRFYFEDSGIATIIYLWNFYENREASAHKAAFEETEAFVTGFEGLFHTIKVLAAQKEFKKLQFCGLTNKVWKITEEDDSQGYLGSSALPMLKTAMLEISKLQAKVVDIKEEEWEADQLYEMIAREAGSFQKEAGIAYRGTVRYAEGIKEVESPKSNVFSQVKEQGLYVVVGGASGIGAGIVDMLKSLGNPRVAVIGRKSEHDRKIKDFLRESGEGVVYYSCDIADSPSVNAVIEECITSFGKINGIFQCAGLLSDKLIHFKNMEDCNKVLQAKITGTYNLVSATKDLGCDFFVSCSSIVSVLGNTGQIDYAAANAFLDSYMEYLGQKYTETYYGSINWTLWQEGGMGRDSRTVDKFRETAGIIKSYNGYYALRQILGGRYNRIMAVSNEEGFLQAFHRESRNSGPDLGQQRAISLGNNINIKDEIIKMLSAILGLKEQDIEEEIDLRELGMESISLIDFSEAMAKKFKIDINASLLFEYTTIREITDFISKHFEPEEDSTIVQETENRSEDLPKMTELSPDNSFSESDIAIIGFSGHFPDSSDYREFWDNLVTHHEFIREIPKDRWDWESLAQKEKKTAGKTNVRWGAFLSDIAGFDASFFHISPKEAELMDPQQRIVLEDSWHALEGAGYKPLEVRGSKTGVFIGACSTDYGDMMIKNNLPLEAYTSTGSYLSIIPGRVSYFFDFHGPSLAVDTACSSSLTAIYQGVRALQAGDCNMALAGGINIMATPRYHLSFDNAGMLSPKGYCSTFDEGADGYARAEGSGIIVLKRLKDAIADKDTILSTIKGVGINHGGMANSLTAPNPLAQRELIKDVYKRAGITADTISYIETHGTGTPLGDPIEINSLQAAFAELKGDSKNRLNYCGLGALKSNMGHGEPASGILGVIKVLLCMQNKTLPGNLHFNQMNKSINVENSPFYLLTENKEWVPLTDDSGHELPRRAGVSSFGFGGANGHIIMEEYQKKNREIKERREFFVLSGKTEKQLKLYAQRMLDFLNSCQKPLKKDMVSGLQAWLVNAFSEEININSKAMSLTDEFLNIGCDTIIFQNVISRLRTELDIILPLEAFIANNSIETLAQFISANFTQEVKTFFGGADVLLEQEEIKDNWNYPKSLREITYTLQHGREDMEERLAFLADSFSTASSYLDAYLKEEEKPGLFTGRVSVNYKRKSEAGIDISGIEDSLVLNSWIQGEKINWNSIYSEIDRPELVLLPEYPFEHKNFWLPVSNPVIPFHQTLEEVKKSELHFYHSSFREAGLTKETQKDYELFNLIGDSEFWQEYALLPGGGKHLLFDSSVTQEMLENYFYNRYRGRQEVSKILLLEKEIAVTETDRWQQVLKRYQLLSKAISSSFRNKVSIYVITVTKSRTANAAYAFFKSLESVLSNVTFNTVMIMPDTATDINLTIKNELENSKTGQDIRYEHNKRFVRELQAYTKTEEKYRSFGSGKTYLITGGLGGIGKILARYLVKEYKANLILTGRSSLNSEKQYLIKELEGDSGKILYLPWDVTTNLDSADLDRIHNTFGAVNGIIHCAGFLSRDNILVQSQEDMFQTLQVKIKGAVELAKSFRNEPLDFFVLFSSISADLGDFGQCSYAMANALLNNCVDYIHSVRGEGMNQTKAISIHWPLWENGGMHIDQGGEALYLKSSKMKYLEDALGMEAFETILTHGADSILVLAGDKKELDNSLGVSNEILVQMEESEIIMENFRDDTKVLEEIKRIASDILKLKKEELQEDAPLSEFGFDSILLKQFAADINDRFTINIMPSVFFANSTLKALAGYLSEKEKVRIEEKAGCKENQYKEPDSQGESDSDQREEDIAIIGMSFQLPKAVTPEEFWGNLINQKEVITEIPKERWNFEDNYGDLNTSESTTNSKWGGFIEGIDQFDPGFFRMTPKESELTDPQQRLLLETVWRLFEDAGYQGSVLKGRDIGVFIGAQTNEYRDLVKEAGHTSGQATVGNALAMLSNRISYFFDFHGISQTVETACSSSLVAIHNAVRALLNKEISMAVVGGVNLSVTEESYITAARLGILSSDGRCKTFDKSANGYVKGEGVIAILLKPFKEAVKDGDNIHAVIKGVGVNHGGTASSITAPNSNAQAQLLKNTYKNANINTATISYIETHGTGTELGDPVEIEGLKLAFSEIQKEYGEESACGYCGLSSVKTNIGHLEPAAGLAGLIKIILSMKHKTFPGIMNFKELNSYIHLENTPFYIVKENREWTRLKEKNGNEIPRRAGISSFGFGGTNAHLIVEEYDNPKETVPLKGEELFVFSARTPKVLEAYLESFIKFLESEGERLNLSEAAYTLQTGREAMKYRGAVIGTGPEELVQGLKKILNQQPGDNIFTGEAAENNGENYASNSLTQLARAWVKGEFSNWSEFYKDTEINKISLPTYPFDNQRYWVKENRNKEQMSAVKAIEAEKVHRPQKDLLQSVLVQDWMDTGSDYVSKSIHFRIHKEHIGIITMEDRENKNMFSMDLVKGLMSVFHQINSMEEIKAVIVEGYDNIFAMGGMKQTLLNIANRDETCADATFVYDCILHCKVPVIAAMQGHAFGGGFTFGLFADITIASAESLYSANFMQYGFTPGVGTTYILKEKLGSGLANELMYTAKTYTGSELQQRGVSIQVMPQSEVYAAALEIAENIIKKPAQSVRVFKANMSEIILETLPSFIEREARMQEIAFAKMDAHGLIDHFFDRSEEKTVKAAETAEPEKKSGLKLLQGQAVPIMQKEFPNKGITLNSKKEPTTPVEINKDKDYSTNQSNPISSKKESVIAALKGIINEVISVPTEHLDNYESFKDMGIDSISGLEIVRKLNKNWGITLDSIVIYDHPSIQQLAEKIMAVQVNDPASVKETNYRNEEEPLFQSFANQSIKNRQPKSINSINPLPSGEHEKKKNEVKKFLCEVIEQLTGIERESLNSESTFKEMGIDSINGLELIRDINHKYKANIETIAIYDYCNIETLSDYITGNLTEETKGYDKGISEEEEELKRMLTKLYNNETDLEEVSHYLRR